MEVVKKSETLILKNVMNNKDIDIMYFCKATTENYNLLIDSGFTDINNCKNYLDYSHHIRFHFDNKTLYWERVGNFCLGRNGSKIVFNQLTTEQLKFIIKESYMAENNKPNLDELIKVHSVERERLEKLNATIDFYKSLKDAVQKAGGCSNWITENTTLKELADPLAINNVRFYYANITNQRGV